MKTIDIKFMELCDEIDFWKQEAKYYKAKYEEELKFSAQENDRRLKESQKGVANALMFAMSVKDNEDGSLSISKESRKALSSTFKTDKK